MTTRTYVIDIINEASKNKQLNRFVENRKLRTAMTDAHKQQLFTIPMVKKLGAISSLVLANDLDYIVDRKDELVDKILWQYKVLKSTSDISRFYTESAKYTVESNATSIDLQIVVSRQQL